MKNTYNRYRAQPKVTRTPEEQKQAAGNASRSSSHSSSSKRHSYTNETQPVQSFKTQAAVGPDPRKARSYTSSHSSSSHRAPVQQPPKRVEAPAHRSEYKAPPAPQKAPSSTSPSKYTAPRQSKTRSIVAMILGIASIVIGWGYYYGAIAGIACGIIALCLQAADKKAGVIEGSAFRKCAKICGIIGIILSSIALIYWIVITAGAFALRSAFTSALYDLY